MSRTFAAYHGSPFERRRHLISWPRLYLPLHPICNSRSLAERHAPVTVLFCVTSFAPISGPKCVSECLLTRHTAQNSLAVSSTSETRVARVLSRCTGRNEFAWQSGRMLGFTMLGQIDVQCQCFRDATHGLPSLDPRLRLDSKLPTTQNLCTHTVVGRKTCIPCVFVCLACARVSCNCNGVMATFSSTRACCHCQVLCF